MANGEAPQGAQKDPQQALSDIMQGILQSTDNFASGIAQLPNIPPEVVQEAQALAEGYKGLVSKLTGSGPQAAPVMGAQAPEAAGTGAQPVR